MLKYMLPGTLIMFFLPLPAYHAKEYAAYCACPWLGCTVHELAGVNFTCTMDKQNVIVSWENLFLVTVACKGAGTDNH